MTDTAAAPATATPAADIKVTDAGKAADSVASATLGGAAVTTGEKPAAAATASDMWGDKWREDYAGTDDKRLNQLKRYASPKAAMDALFAAQQKISSGALKEALPKDATAEQIAEYRKSNGIPETPDKYDTNLGDGLVIGEADKPLVNKFLEKMHAANASPEQLKSALTAYYEIQKDFLTQQKDADQTYRTSAENTLRSEWGNDYQRNLNMVVNLRDQMPEELQNRIFGGRTADGKTLGDDPAFLNWFHSVAAEVNPVGAIIPSGSGGSMDSIMAEKAALEKKMGTKAYGQAERARMIEINTALEKTKSRAA